MTLLVNSLIHDFLYHTICCHTLSFSSRDIEEISKDRMQCVKDINMKETDEVMKSKNTSSMEGMNPIEAVSKNIFILCPVSNMNILLITGN